MNQIPDVIQEIKESQKTTYHRGKSWEHCYVFFRNHEKFHNDEKLLDSAALNLGFFLASWGMLRGSSFLLQKDYKFYIPIVRTLIMSEFDGLWNVDFLNNPKERDIKSLFHLKEKLMDKIKENNGLDGDNKEHQIDLIITKIIMATMGCVPAYDRFFKDGLKKFQDNLKNKKKRCINFNKDSFENLLKLLSGDNKIKKIYKKSCFIQGTNIKYPPMKLLDLYFWLLGLEK
jgi:hypothetical protein